MSFLTPFTGGKKMLGKTPAIYLSEVYLELGRTSMKEPFLKNYLTAKTRQLFLQKKSSVKEFQLGSKYASVFLLPKENLFLRLLLFYVKVCSSLSMSKKSSDN